MKKITKNLMLVIVMAALCFAVAVTANAETVTGECGIDGDNLIWFLDTETGILFIDGEGEMSDFDNPPWADFREDIYTVIISRGVTSISESAFAECYRIEGVSLPESIKAIDDYSFLCCLGLKEFTIPKNIESIGTEAFAILPFLERVTVKSMDVNLSEFSLCVNEFAASDISREDFIDLFSEYYNGVIPYEEVDKHLEYSDNYIFIGTIYCHSGSTAEAYAIENNMEYVTMHFFEGEWTYDYENMVRFRKCIHCDELETEQLEVTEIGDVEIINPSDPDTDFTVDEIVKGGDNYVIIENALGGNITGDWEVVKAFDITLKNHDGVHVQPDGTVKVKLPLDWSKDGVYKVYRVNDDGTLTDMNAYRQGSHMVFETDHFSIYVIVDESEKAEAPEDVPTEAPAEKLDFIQKLLNFFTSLLEFFRSLFGI